MRVRCGECAACKHAECGECKHCLGKKKFGGDGSSKFACIHRRCRNKKLRNTEIDNSSTSGNNTNQKEAPNLEPDSKQKQKRQSRSRSSTSSPSTSQANGIRVHSDNNNDGGSTSSATMSSLLPSLGIKSPSTSNASSSNMSQQTQDEDILQRPSSLLDVSSPIRKRKRTLLAAERIKQELEDPSVPASRTHMHGIPIPEERFQVCARCGSNYEHDTIILCDGKGCQKEFHLKCCIPPLHEVPEGAYYCFDCSPTGSTAQLEEYLEHHDREKLLQEDPDEYATTLLYKDVLDEHHPKCEIATETPKELPRSELDWIHRNDPESLVGMAVRLYSTHGNSYHNGRIIDVKSRPNKTTDTECLIRFPAGNDARKTSYTSWISLEEHCVAVCTQILWAKFADRQWKPARLWSRSARELVPLMYQLTRTGGAIRQATKTAAADSLNIQKPDWGLIENILGSDKYEYTELASSTSRSLPPRSKSLETRDMEIMNALVQTELDAQNRVRKWRKLPLLEAMHPMALRCRDEADLGPLEFQVVSTTTTTGPIKPSPLIPQGLDRSYILEQVSKRWKNAPATKDLAASLLCQLVESPPSTVQSFTWRDRNTLSYHKSEMVESSNEVQVETVEDEKKESGQYDDDDDDDKMDLNKKCNLL